MEVLDAEQTLKQLSKTLTDAEHTIKLLAEDLAKRRRETINLLESFRGTHVKPEHFDAFVKKPYTIVPRGEKEWFLIVPKFLDFQYGWLFTSDDAYNIFIINRYVTWLYPIPQELNEDLGMEKPWLDAKVIDGMLHVPEDKVDEAFQRYKEYLSRREGPGQIRIKKFSEFDLMSNLIRDGILPFEPQPVAVDDISDFTSGIMLRDYQEHALKTFLSHGAIGVYWPPGAGKMFLALHALSVLKGLKLIVVPTLMLVEEWKRKIRQYVPGPQQQLINVTTYISAEKYREGKLKFTLVVYDEHQHLPANTYARLATIPTKYRMGLCLDKRSLILTPWGYRRLDGIKVGDYVMSFNFERKKFEKKPVLSVSSNKARKISVIVETSKGNKTIICSPEHRIFSKGKFIQAKDLSSGAPVIVEGIYAR